MEIFINECSLHGQYQNNYGFNDSIKNFVACLNMISGIDNTKFYKSRNFYSSSGIEGKHFETCLKAHHSINELFVQNLQIVNPKIWEDKQVHDSSLSYIFKGIDYKNKSVAELAERNNTNGVEGLLINFENSIFSENHLIDIVKNGKITIIVECIDDTAKTHNWLVENDYLKPDNTYDENSDFPPTDFQSILNDSDIFESTQFRNQGRKVFKRIDTNELWVVDGSKRHAGQKAHCEIFDETTRKHLGTSLYNEVNLNPKYKKENRFITLP